MTGATLFGLLGAALAGMGLYGAIVQPEPLCKVLGLNLLGGGLFLIFGAVARRGAAAGLAADPVPQALVITGIVVAFAATALAVTLLLRLFELTGRATRSPGAAEARKPGEAQCWPRRSPIQQGARRFCGRPSRVGARPWCSRWRSGPWRSAWCPSAPSGCSRSAVRMRRSCGCHDGRLVRPARRRAGHSAAAGGGLRLPAGAGPRLGSAAARAGSGPRRRPARRRCAVH